MATTSGETDRTTSIHLVCGVDDHGIQSLEALAEFVAKSTRLTNLKIEFSMPHLRTHDVETGLALCSVVRAMAANPDLPLIRLVVGRDVVCWLDNHTDCVYKLMENSNTLRCVSITIPGLVEDRGILPTLRASVTVDEVSYYLTDTGDRGEVERKMAAVDVYLEGNARTGRLFLSGSVDIGCGQYMDSGGDLAKLPNELLCIVATRFPAAIDLVQLAHTCRLLRDVALANYVLQQRYPVLARPQPWVNRLRYVFRECYLESRTARE